MGNLYGTTAYGGTDSPCPEASGHASGTVFKITLRGALTTLYSFCSQSGCPGRRNPLRGAHPSYRWRLLRDNI